MVIIPTQCGNASMKSTALRRFHHVACDVRGCAANRYSFDTHGHPLFCSAQKAFRLSSLDSSLIRLPQAKRMPGKTSPALKGRPSSGDQSLYTTASARFPLPLYFTAECTFCTHPSGSSHNRRSVMGSITHFSVVSTDCIDLRKNLGDS